MKIGQIAEILTMLILGYVLKSLGWRTTMIIGDLPVLDGRGVRRRDPSGGVLPPALGEGEGTAGRGAGGEGAARRLRNDECPTNAPPMTKEDRGAFFFRHWRGIGGAFVISTV